MLDLVNENYQDFLSLGGSLQGGEEKIEEVRLGLLGFKRDVGALKDKVGAKQKEVEGLVTERKAIREDIQLGRTLLDIDQRLQDLEERLMISLSKPTESPEDDENVSESSDGENISEDERSDGISISRLQGHAQQYLCVTKLRDKIGMDHPFLVKQQGRVTRLRNTILLDLSSALKQSVKSMNQERTMKILAIYRDMDEAEEATKTLKDKKR